MLFRICFIATHKGLNATETNVAFGGVFIFEGTCRNLKVETYIFPASTAHHFSF